MENGYQRDIGTDEGVGMERLVIDVKTPDVEKELIAPEFIKAPEV